MALGVPILKHFRVRFYFKVNGDNFRGSNSAILIFASILKGDPFEEQFLSIKASFWESYVVNES